MRAYCVTPAFGLENAALRELPTPEPARGQVLLRVRAASLNYRDLLVAKGEYNPRYPLPLVLGSDAACEIVALGPETQLAGFGSGDRVCPLFAQGWLSGAPKRQVMQGTLGGPLPGVLAEYVLARSDSLVRIPDYLDDLQAATLPCAALTAWSALRVLSPIEPGDRVLTIGSGGVALFALQIARAAGATVLALSRSAEKRARLLALGATAALSSEQPGWGRAIRDLAPDQGVDHVVEVGGVGTLGESLQAVRPGGTISFIGTVGQSGQRPATATETAGRGAAPDLLPIVMRNLRLQGVFVGHRQSFEAMVASFAASKLEPVIDSVFALEQASQAFARLASGDQFGKICLQIS